MIKLKDGMTLYHGSYTAVPKIDLSKCAPNKDFGRGFYVTSSLEQAQSFVRLSLRRSKFHQNQTAEGLVGYVSSYRLTLSDLLYQKTFEQADIEWLHFVVANRDETIFPNLLDQYRIYNVVIGKIANDRTATTLQAYMENVYGTVGTPNADRIAIETLLPNRLENQICFRDENAVSCLTYIGSEEYGTGTT